MLIVEFVTIFYVAGERLLDGSGLVDKHAGYRLFVQVPRTACHVTNLLAVLHLYVRFPPNSDV